MGSHADSGLNEDVTRRLNAALVAVFRRPSVTVTKELRLGDIGGWDSMNAVTFTFELENAFNVTLGETMFHANHTIADVVRVLRERGALKGN